MSATNDGGPTFPIHLNYVGGTISVRDYFAAAALASMTVAPDYSKGSWNGAMAERAYAIADAMLAERKKVKP